MVTIASGSVKCLQLRAGTKNCTGLRSGFVIKLRAAAAHYSFNKLEEEIEAIQTTSSSPTANTQSLPMVFPLLSSSVKHSQRHSENLEKGFSYSKCSL